MARTQGCGLVSSCETERSELVLNSLPLFVHSGTLTLWTEPPLLRVGLPTSVSFNPENSSHIYPEVCL